VHGYEDGQRVHHCVWNCDGTVRVVNENTAEVEWDGLATADELTDVLAANLRPEVERDTR
jgi:hypothetical protein